MQENMKYGTDTETNLRLGKTPKMGDTMLYNRQTIAEVTEQ